MTQNSRPGFDTESHEIISVMDELSLWSAPFGLKLLDAVRCHPGLTVLDIGSGLGFPLTELAMRLGGNSVVYGVDPWFGGVRRTKEKMFGCGIENALIICGHAERLPFRERSFDLVTSNNGINNVEDVKRTFTEISRVTKPGGQFVFTFNTERTFLAFYEAYRETLYDLGLPECNKALQEHIRKKRKPVAFMEHLAASSGFRVISVQDEMFAYRFADARAMLDHFFIRLAFLEAWRNIVPASRLKEVFQGIEKRLNDLAKQTGEIRMNVPFVVFDCERT